MNCDIDGVGDGFRQTDPRIAYLIKGAPQQNFGDYLPELLANTLLAFPKVDAAIFRFIGSVIDDRWIRRDFRRAKGRMSGMAAYWGCGARSHSPLSPEVRRHVAFFGVRGPLTRSALQLPGDTVLGDPGLLVPLAHSPRASTETEGKAVCIRHVHDQRSDDELLAMSGADIALSPIVAASREALTALLDKIASADFVLTASLHGAIIACAYGRPFAYWNNGHRDVPFKWDDFSRSIGIAPPFVRTVSQARESWQDHRDSIRKPGLLPLLVAAPFTTRPGVLLRAAQYDLGPKATTAQAAAHVESFADAMEQQILDCARMSAQARMASYSPVTTTIDAGSKAFWQVKRKLQTALDRP